MGSNAIWHEGTENKSRLGKFFEKSIVARRILLFIAMLGMCMLIGDGILTPAISGLSPWPFLIHFFSCWRNIHLALKIFLQYCQLWMASGHLFLLSVNVSMDSFYNVVISFRILQLYQQLISDKVYTVI